MENGEAQKTVQGENSMMKAVLWGQQIMEEDMEQGDLGRLQLSFV